MSKIETTLCLLKRNNEILLAMKKGGFGIGKYNGVGGKIEKNETPEAAMIREAKEEILVTPTQYKKVGLVEFDEYYKGKQQNLLFHLYMVYDWQGIPTESDEMNPKWFPISDIPYDQMFSDDQYWLPLVLEGNKINAYFKFDENWNLIEKEIQQLKEEQQVI
ncbi:MAG: 8-oxo-dGTP diphosphatase [Bacilli bacterium]|nr:8-oxo-dGTP diphosphatase [Bacilli bacterium]